MIYSLLRWIVGIALYWFYRDIRIVGKERIPHDGPLLIAVNHQNALIDSLVVSWLAPRRVAMTAKATLAANPFIALLFKALHVVPLRRANDEASKGDKPLDRSRNAEAFREIVSILEHGGAVLIFPEGKSHNESGLEPLKTGLARLALQARDSNHVAGLRILPLGLVFEDKGTPGSVVDACIGQPIEMDTWSGTDYDKLTDEVANRLRSVSENAELSPSELRVSGVNPHTVRERLVSLAAWWGRLTHQVPVRMARNIAVRRSRSADEPAMLTILFGVALVLMTYAIHLTLVGLIAHSFLIDCLYLASLVSGAYWAAFQQHPRRY